MVVPVLDYCSKVCDIAAYRHNKQILRWAVKEGFLIGEGLFASTAIGGHVFYLG